MAKVPATRSGDMFYDPLYIVSGPRDHYKQAKIALMQNAKFTVCPIFPTMFTDLPHVPRHQLVVKTSMSIPPFVDKSQSTFGHKGQAIERQVDVDGVDRYKFFHQPIPKLSSAIIPALSLVSSREDRSSLGSRLAPHPDSQEKRKVHLKYGKYIHNPEAMVQMVNRQIQTQYRDSSAQTSPWQPDFKVIDGSDPEILKLDFLKWGQGLPAGAHEMLLIERARMKRAWEKRLPPITDKRSIEKRREVIEAMERDEWAFREQEIQDIQNVRMELLEKMLRELLETTKVRSDKKMQMFCKQKLQEKNEKLFKLKMASTREQRRLAFNHKGIIMKYHPVNIVNEHADYKSELYAPLMRHGAHPKRWHQVINEHFRKYRAKFQGVEKYETLPKWLSNATNIDYDIKLPGTRLCIRETKWSNPVLKDLHQELKALRTVNKSKCTLRVRIKEKEAPPPTPEVENEQTDDEQEEAVLMLQSVLRGRAAQVLVFDGRDNCRELIQELRSTHGVLDKEIIKVFKQKLEIKYDQRDEAFCISNSSKIQEALNRLQGTIVGTLLDFLNKELRRLLDERKAHALGLMAERERYKREAAEAGRRQAELRRRREHDEIFKQVAKVHQETVDLYLEDIITEGLDFASTTDAKQYVTTLAKKLDKEIYETDDIIKNDINEQEELIADLVYHFVLPEVEKQIVRQRIKQRQSGELKAIHEQLFGTFETLPKPDKQNHTEKSSQVEMRTVEGLPLIDDSAVIESFKKISSQESHHSTKNIIDILDIY